MLLDVSERKTSRASSRKNILGNPGQSVSKGAVFEILNAERSEAESVEVECRLTGLHT